MAAFIRGKWNPPKDTQPDLSGQIVIVTGSNTGLGFEAAQKFVKLGCKKVILAVRSLPKGEVAKGKIEAQTGRKDVAEVWQLDMLDHDSIRAFAKRASGLEHLNIALLNAGVYSTQYEQAKYGWERTFQVNVLSTVLLSLLLLPKLKQSKTAQTTPVLEIVGSGTHKSARFRQAIIDSDMDLLQAYNDKDGFSGREQYGISKLFVQYAVQQMASMQKTPDNTIDTIVLSVCPGACASELSRGYSGILMDTVRAIVFPLAFRTAEQGSRTYISGATLGKKGHGRFWQHDVVQEQEPQLIGSQGEQLQKRSWTSIINALSQDVPEVKNLLA